MAKKNKPAKEYIPEGMSRKNYADAAYRKKVTIIMGAILLVFVIGVVAVLVNVWLETERHNQEFEAREQAFIAEKNNILAQLGSAQTDEDKARVKITVTDETFSDWIATLDETYNKLNPEDEGYAAFEGASIEIEGMFFTRVFENGAGAKQYWVFRLHDHDGQHEHDESEEITNYEEIIGEMIPIEIIFADENAQPFEDGTWVKVSGVVGKDSTKSLSAVREAVATVMEEQGEAHID